MKKKLTFFSVILVAFISLLFVSCDTSGIYASGVTKQPSDDRNLQDPVLHTYNSASYIYFKSKNGLEYYDPNAKQYYLLDGSSNAIGALNFWFTSDGRYLIYIVSQDNYARNEAKYDYYYVDLNSSFSLSSSGSYTQASKISSVSGISSSPCEQILKANDTNVYTAYTDSDYRPYEYGFVKTCTLSSSTLTFNQSQSVTCSNYYLFSSVNGIWTFTNTYDIDEDDITKDNAGASVTYKYYNSDGSEITIESRSSSNQAGRLLVSASSDNRVLLFNATYDTSYANVYTNGGSGNSYTYVGQTTYSNYAYLSNASYYSSSSGYYYFSNYRYVYYVNPSSTNSPARISKNAISDPETIVGYFLVDSDIYVATRDSGFYILSDAGASAVITSANN